MSDPLARIRSVPDTLQLPCLSLDRRPLRAWNGLLFEGRRDVAAELAGFSMADALDYSD